MGLSNRVGLVFVAFSVVFVPVAAAAQSVTVLGIRSVEGDDDFALQLTGALRHAASQVPGWQVSDREVSLSQMALAHGCDDPDAHCLTQIAGSLQAERLVYGTVRRTSSREDYDYSVTLHLFEASRGEIAESLTDTIPRVQSDIDQLRGRVRGYIARLSGTSSGGTLHLVSNVPGAQVYVDGAEVGLTGADGSLTAEADSGTRRIEVVSDGYETYRGSVDIQTGEESTLEVELQEGASTAVGGDTGGDGISFQTVAGISLIGVAAVAGALAIAGMIINDGINGDDLSVRARTQVGQHVQDMTGTPANAVDVCEELNGFPADSLGSDMAGATASVADLTQFKDDCSTGSTWFAIQIVGAIIAGVTAAAGIVLLATDSGGEGGSAEAEDGVRLTLQPSVGPERAGLGATLTF